MGLIEGRYAQVIETQNRMNQEKHEAVEEMAKLRLQLADSLNQNQVLKAINEAQKQDTAILAYKESMNTL